MIIWWFGDWLKQSTQGLACSTGFDDGGGDNAGDEANPDDSQSWANLFGDKTL